MSSRWRSAATAGWRTPSRRRSAPVTAGQPPRATIASYCGIACSVVCAVAGESVGSEAVGILMVREAEIGVLILIDQRIEQLVVVDGVCRPRAGDQRAAPRQRTQERAPADKSG